MREWIYGRNPVFETLRAGRRQVFRLLAAQGAKEKGRLREIIQLGKARTIPLERVPRESLDKIARDHQGIAIEASGYSYCALQDILVQAKRRSEIPFLLVLDVLQDPQNLGTLLRTAEAVGVHGVLLPHRHAAGITPAVVSASSGASEHLLIAQTNLAQAIQSLKEEDIWVMGLDNHPEAQCIDQVRLEGPIALVVGSEGRGMRSLVRDSCDLLMRLPMRGEIESLNAAAAGSIALYLVWHARGYAFSGT